LPSLDIKLGLGVDEIVPLSTLPADAFPKPGHGHHKATITKIRNIRMTRGLTHALICHQNVRCNDWGETYILVRFREHERTSQTGKVL